jgi:hypothetical protein
MFVLAGRTLDVPQAGSATVAPVATVNSGRRTAPLTWAMPGWREADSASQARSYSSGPAVDTTKDDAAVEARILHTPYAMYQVRPWHGRQRDGGGDIVEEANAMSIGVSIFLLVVGAILTFAVEVSASGFNINTVGIILMLAGGLGLLLSLLFWSSFSPWSRRRTVARGDTVIEERRIERDLP